MIGNQPDEYEDITLAMRVRTLLDCRRPSAAAPLTRHSLASLASGLEIARVVSSDELDNLLESRATYVSEDLRAALCDPLGVPQSYLESAETTESVRRYTLQLRIGIEIRDRGITYLAGRAGSSPTLAELAAVLQTLQQIPIKRDSPS
ncbi:hypothetical protein [Rhodococcus rhodnii]|uniref:hypothetical protein n=1 Tax=Rhodococcus rhodnii TaxID=38312 RepID=UPI00093316FB|nr:hypothetical protein [Rhodococcus rhodnii]